MSTNPFLCQNCDDRNKHDLNAADPVTVIKFNRTWILHKMSFCVFREHLVHLVKILVKNFLVKNNEKMPFSQENDPLPSFKNNLSITRAFCLSKCEKGLNSKKGSNLFPNGPSGS